MTVTGNKKTESKTEIRQKKLKLKLLGRNALLRPFSKRFPPKFSNSSNFRNAAYST